jgi:emp24/gp25L/p24 family/GOLD
MTSRLQRNVVQLSFALLCASLSVTRVVGLHFYLPAGVKRCFTEDLPTSTRVTGEVAVATGKGEMELDVWVTTMNDAVLYHKRSPSHGKFYFDTPAIHSRQYSGIEEDDDTIGMGYDEETIRICIEHQRDPGAYSTEGARRLVSLRIDHPTPPGNMHASQKFALGDHTTQLQDGLGRIQEALSGLVSDLTLLQQRERVLVKRVHSTNTRVLTCVVISIFFAGLTAFLQLRHFKTYFKQKRLC